MLYALILSDRTIEHHAFARIFCRAAQRVLADSNRFDRDQDALRIESVQDVGEGFAFLADAIGVWNKEPVYEDRIGIHRLAAHLGNSMNIDLRPIEVGVENRDSISRPRAIPVLGRPGQQHDLVCDLRGRGPDLLAMHKVAARNLLREGFDTGGVKSGIRFGETEAALVFARNQPRNPACLLLRRALDDDRMRPCTAEVADIPPPWLATSCIMIAASVTPRPEPPYSSGMVMPSQPASAIAR